MTIMHIPGFTAEASLYTSSIRMNMTSSHDSPIVSPQITPQVMQDPSHKPPIIVKSNCYVVCFYSAGHYICRLIC
jgi:hypothetical protein